MPHIILETTADLAENGDVPDILAALAKRLAAFDTVDPRSIKAYHTLRSVWAMGEGAPEGFAHLTVAILSGRPPELRQAIADGMFETLREAFASSAGEASLTLELREMDAATYRKALA
jgi:5-carboxymethyl-2-hydroxymuconate isomerase